jgi:molybdate transport system ATP-binding protein
MLKISFIKTLGQFQLDVHFQVSDDLVALFGPSGAGKSSILEAIAGLLPPDQGLIQVNDVIFLDSQKGINLPPQDRQVGYVFQSYALFPHLNVAENVGFALNKWPRRQRRSRIHELLVLLELQDLATQSVRQISGGQAQRVALARAIAPHPKLLLLDEPFSALDDDLRRNLRTQLKMIQRQLALPILFVTHSRAEALELADQVVTLEAGQVINLGKPEQILDRRLTHRVRSQFRWG